MYYYSNPFQKIELSKYYETPPDKVFKDIQLRSCSLWSQYDDTYGYATKKITYIMGLENIKDNAWVIVSMFDSINQMTLWQSLSVSTKDYVLSIQEAK